jgi:pimeloyl-ACP methyl ester carboxylesterase
VKGIIIECPYESLLQTAKNRFEKMGIPTFPFAHFLVFWGGIENGFWGFSLNPAEYSKSIKIPTLLIYGEKDGRVKRFEIDNIYANLKGKKELLIFPEAGHGNYIQTNKDEWVKNVDEFLKN